MLIQKDIDLTRPLNDDQKEMLDSMASKPFSADPDCPELTPEQLQKMYKAALESDGENCRLFLRESRRKHMKDAVSEPIEVMVTIPSSSE